MTLSIDDAFEAVAHADRRRLLIALADHTSQADRSIRYPEDLPAESGDRFKTTRIRMYHNHLPKLETAGYIEWERDTGEIAKGPNFAMIRPLLAVVDDVAVPPRFNQ